MGLYTFYTLQRSNVKRLTFYSFTKSSSMHPAGATVVTGRSDWRKRPFEPYWIYYDEMWMQAGKGCPHSDLHAQARSVQCAHIHTHTLTYASCTHACTHLMLVRTYASMRTHTQMHSYESVEGFSSAFLLQS